MSILKPLFYLFSLLYAFQHLSCTSPNEIPMGGGPDQLEESKQQIWVYTHSIRSGHDYTVFSPEKPMHKGILPGEFLAIKNKERENWTCLMKWENDELWFYTPSSRSFASHNSENGKTHWTIIEEDDYNYFFYEDKETDFIRFSSRCGQPEVLCLNAEELVIGQ